MRDLPACHRDRRAALARGIGAALYEEVVYDEAGQILTARLTDYAVPRTGDAPSIKAQHLEAESPTTVGGFRGKGDGGTIGAPAAIANALADALTPLGADVVELPMTSDRLFRLLQKKRQVPPGHRRRDSFETGCRVTCHRTRSKRAPSNESDDEK